ncbi:transglutaminaseTgpA domain-containing protein [Streptomyces sp. NPDC046887]|uniref:transglutaminaseTgpA domain-containing protein n=1 Tax=Streptomyces sp. NPDC046887 TaxID=3155472 RepID=UPI0033E55B43
MLAETICSAVSAAGLGLAAITAYRKRFRTAARIAGYALVPLGLVMTGAVAWLARTAFSPVAWAGFGVLGLAWLLFATTRAVERRRGPGTREERRAARRQAEAPAASTPAAVTGPAERPAGRPAPKRAGAGSGRGGEDDFSDIEAILKKHGI